MMILAFLAGFMACLFVVMIFNARNIAAARRRRKKDRQEHPEKKFQFSPPHRGHRKNR